jgi:hypothetical protein
MSDIPEEDKWLNKNLIKTDGAVTPRPPQHEHEYVDFYAGWRYVDKEATKQVLWVFCKKCLDKKKLYLDMSEVYSEDYDD